jgi:hypothetical protein
MAFAPSNKKEPGMKPYSEAAAHPNGARRHAVGKHFGMKQPQISDHQIKSVWDFLYSKGFRIKRCVSMSIDKTAEPENQEALYYHGGE